MSVCRPCSSPRGRSTPALHGLDHRPLRSASISTRTALGRCAISCASACSVSSASPYAPGVSTSPFSSSARGVCGRRGCESAMGVISSEETELDDVGRCLNFWVGGSEMRWAGMAKEPTEDGATKPIWLIVSAALSHRQMISHGDRREVPRRDGGKMSGIIAHPLCHAVSQARRTAARYRSKMAITNTPMHTPTVAPADEGIHEANHSTGVSISRAQSLCWRTVGAYRPVEVHLHPGHTPASGRRCG